MNHPQNLESKYSCRELPSTKVFSNKYLALSKGQSRCSLFFNLTTASFFAECNQLMNSPGNTLSDQIIAISQSGQNQRESEAHIQSLLSQSASVQNNMSACQNMVKADDLLISLPESGGSLTRSF